MATATRSILRIVLAAIWVAQSALPASIALADAGGRINTGWYFDWDKNLFSPPSGYPPKVYIYNKKTGEEKGISAGDFAGEWAKLKDDWTLKVLPKGGSFKNYQDVPGRNLFLEQLQAVIKLPPEQWQGPAFKAFIHALSDPTTAEDTGLISAREQSPEHVLEALKFLQQELAKQGVTIYLPKLEHVFPVGNEKFASLGKETPERKAKVMTQVLDEIQAKKVNSDAPEVVDAAGTGKRRMNLWGYSDDDYANISAAIKTLSAEVKNGRWPDVKITLFFTGTNNPDHRPGAVVIKPDGTTRPLTAEELAHSVMYGDVSTAHEAVAEKAAPAPETAHGGIVTAPCAAQYEEALRSIAR